MEVGASCEAKVPGGWSAGTVVSSDAGSYSVKTASGITFTCSEVRAPPLPPSDDFLSGLDVEAAVEALTTDGVWKPAIFLACKMLRGEDGARKCQCTVRIGTDEVVVDEAGVRPCVAAGGSAGGDDAMAVDGGADGAPAADADAPPPPPPKPTIQHPVEVGAVMSCRAQYFLLHAYTPPISVE